MEQYTLKLSQGTSYKLYEGTTLMPDIELEALFASNDSAYFIFDFDGGTPSSTTTVQIVDSTDEMIIEKTGVSISEDRNYKGTWSGATTFDSFETLNGKSLDEYQVKFLMSEIKRPVGTSKIDDSAVTESKIANSAVTTNKLADGSVTGAANAATDVTGSKVALSTVGTPNMRDSAITTAKLADDAVTTAKIVDANVTSAKLADSAVTTAKIANAAVTSGKIANGAVTSEKIDFTTINMSAPTTTVITNYGTISSQGSRVMAQSGFLVGKAVCLQSDTHAHLTLANDDDTDILAGIPFEIGSSNFQIGFCVPVYKGQTIYFRLGSNAQFEHVRLVASHSAAAL